jgi:radical SAM protein with 4Fe4S-binding SPASM domain
LEITARCNNNCRHCYINLPANDLHALGKELSFNEIREMADEAVSLGALWCLITGGEPLLREDFIDIYLHLKKRGVLVSVFTNATLIREEHIKLFRRYPPRDLEVTVYGVTPETYESITRNPGSFDAFQQGLNLLVQGGVPFRLKTMALRSNFHEIKHIIDFCRLPGEGSSRFDPFLHLRYDGNPEKNAQIRGERLLPEEIVGLERLDQNRFSSLRNTCDPGRPAALPGLDRSALFRCGAGRHNVSLSYQGEFRLCSCLSHPDCVYDARKGTLTEAWHTFLPRLREMRSHRREFLDTCAVCPLTPLCFWCPAHAYLELGVMDMPVTYFCNVAQARAEMISENPALLTPTHPFGSRQHQEPCFEETLKQNLFQLKGA